MKPRRMEVKEEPAPEPAPDSYMTMQDISSAPPMRAPPPPAPKPKREIPVVEMPKPVVEEQEEETEAVEPSDLEASFFNFLEEDDGVPRVSSPRRAGRFFAQDEDSEEDDQWLASMASPAMPKIAPVMVSPDGG